MNMNTTANIEEAKLYKKSEPFLQTGGAEWHEPFPAFKSPLREAVDILLEEAHELEDRAACKRDVYLRRAVEKAILRVHEVADVLESVEYQLAETA